MKKLNLFKAASILLFTIAFMGLSSVVPYLSGAKATAVKNPYYTLNIRNVSQNGTFSGAANNVTLATGETAQIRAQFGNTDAGNDINSLRLKAFFTDTVNPTDFHVDMKADSLAWTGASVNVHVPSGYYLQYVPGSTVLDKDDRPEFLTRTNIQDVNGTSPLAFNDGMNITNFPSGEHQWMWVYFKVVAVQSKPVVINPRLDVTKYVANISANENFSGKKTETTANPGNTLAFQIVVKNGIQESTLHHVVVADQKPMGNATPQNLVANVTSTEANTNKSIKVNITGTQEISLITGSVVLKDLFGNTLKTLSASEVNQLFGSGLNLGDVNGTFEFAKVIEYKAKISEVLNTPPSTPELPNTGAGSTLLLLLGTIPAGLILRAIKFKVA